MYSAGVELFSLTLVIDVMLMLYFVCVFTYCN